MAELARSLIATAPLQEISSLVLESAQKLTSSSYGFVGYIDPASGELVCPTMCREVWADCRVPNKEFVFKEFKGLWGWVLRRRTPLMTNRPEEDPRSQGVPQGHVKIRRFLSAPAMIGSRLYGLLALANPDRDYAREDLEIVDNLASMFALAVERRQTEAELESKTRALKVRIKELNCLYGLARILEEDYPVLDRILKGVVELIPSSWQYPEITRARITLNRTSLVSPGFSTSPWSLSSDIVAHGRRVGLVEVFYLEERPFCYEGPFLQEERDLITAIALRLGRAAEQVQAEEELHRSEADLRVKTLQLEERNTALKVLLDNRLEEKQELEAGILASVEKLVQPYLERLKNTRLDSEQRLILEIVESSLGELASPLLRRLNRFETTRTPSEVRVADLVLHDRTTKEIAGLLGLAPETVACHRRNIRHKLGLTNQKINLRSHLLSLTSSRERPWPGPGF